MLTKRMSCAAAVIFMFGLNGGCDNTMSNPVGAELTYQDALQYTTAAKGAKVAICHITGRGAYRRITVSENALSSHLDHGDARPGRDGLDESCQMVPKPEDPCPCFDTAALAALDLTFGGGAWMVVGDDNGIYTSAYGLSPMFTARAAEAGQRVLDAPYSCTLLDESVQLSIEKIDITQTEAGACRQLIKEAWTELF